MVAYEKSEIFMRILHHEQHSEMGMSTRSRTITYIARTTVAMVRWNVFTFV